MSARKNKSMGRALTISGAVAIAALLGVSAVAADVGNAVASLLIQEEITAEELAAAIVVALEALPADATEEEIEAAIQAVFVETGASLAVQYAALNSPTVVAAAGALTNGASVLVQVNAALQTAIDQPVTGSTDGDGGGQTATDGPPTGPPPVVYVG